MTCTLDDFGRADNPSSLGTATSGESWTLQSTAPYDADGNPVGALTSILGISSGTAYSPDTRLLGTHGEPGYADIATVTTPDADVDASVSLDLGFAEGGGGGLVFRWSSATAFWLAFLYRQIGTGDYYLIVRKQTGASFDSPVVGFAFANGDVGTRVVRVKACGGQITAWAGDALVVDFVDSFNTNAVKHGIVTYFSTTVRLDDLSVCSAECMQKGWTVGSVS